ncbi:MULTISPECIES: hypothetical protein [Nostoc]|uniref:Uncharacterized protein n=1 Tax=Nostoc paludosum FACHB-159 TaxID=2692908 RepID=A0ABR8K9V1_9NOSO|nr:MULTISPECIES: hypothetical protein [Nostoc]MBD2679123.1 hypothetical protein [Nostoc sp. FACHB-857]MBD2735504.1 hypothetical protein [Nostoc paludosum FACHB-159]
MQENSEFRIQNVRIVVTSIISFFSSFVSLAYFAVACGKPLRVYVITPSLTQRREKKSVEASLGGFYLKLTRMHSYTPLRLSVPHGFPMCCKCLMRLDIKRDRIKPDALK